MKTLKVPPNSIANSPTITSHQQDGDAAGNQTDQDPERDSDLGSSRSGTSMYQMYVGEVDPSITRMDHQQPGPAQRYKL